MSGSGLSACSEIGPYVSRFFRYLQKELGQLPFFHGHLNDDIAKGTLSSILKQSGLKLGEEKNV